MSGKQKAVTNSRCGACGESFNVAGGLAKHLSKDGNGECRAHYREKFETVHDSL